MPVTAWSNLGPAMDDPDHRPTEILWNYPVGDTQSQFLRRIPRVPQPTCRTRPNEVDIASNFVNVWTKLCPSWPHRAASVEVDQNRAPSHPSRDFCSRCPSWVDFGPHLFRHWSNWGQRRGNLGQLRPKGKLGKAWAQRPWAHEPKMCAALAWHMGDTRAALDRRRSSGTCAFA